MLRISRLTDYGTLILVHLATQNGRLCSANDVATAVHIALPTVQKLLKLLASSSLAHSTRGAEGGYCLSRPPEMINAAEILDVLEGPVAITECSIEDGHCHLEASCSVGSAWQRISISMRTSLENISLADLGNPPASFPVIDLTPAHRAAQRTSQRS